MAGLHLATEWYPAHLPAAQLICSQFSDRSHLGPSPGCGGNTRAISQLATWGLQYGHQCTSTISTYRILGECAYCHQLLCVGWWLHIVHIVDCINKGFYWKSVLSKDLCLPHCMLVNIYSVFFEYCVNQYRYIWMSQFENSTCHSWGAMGILWL